MEMRWSLKELYPSFDSKEFHHDMKTIDQMIDGIKNWTDENLPSNEEAGRKIEDHIKMMIDFNNIFTKLMSYASLTSSVDVKNEIALKIIDSLQEKYNELTDPIVSFQKWIVSLKNIDKYLEYSKLLKNHSFYLTESINNAKYLLSNEQEILISKMSNTGSRAWSKLQEKLSSTLLVDIGLEGEYKRVPLPIVRNMAYDKDENIRKKAYEAELKAYKKIDESSAASLNGIKGEVITISKMRGYKSPIEQTIIDSRIDETTLNAMLCAIKESLPAFHSYYRRKGELLGYAHGLPFYNLFAPLGQADMKFTYEEAQEYIVKNFRTFSDKLADYANSAFEKNWIDAEPRHGKRGGAFCSNIHAIGESRILANFSGNFSSVTTLAHELGHGYHGLCLAEETILNSNYTMPIAETASIFCETIIMQSALKEGNENQAFSILETSISDAGQVIVDIYSRYLFESELFKKRKDHSLSVNELNDLMISAQKQAYGNGLDHNVLHPYMWVNKPHYYYSSQNFYNFPYAFGLLFAKGVYAEYLNRGDSFIEDYDKLLASSGKKSIPEVTKMIGIDIHSTDFWRSSLQLIQQDISVFIELSKKL